MALLVRLSHYRRICRFNGESFRFRESVKKSKSEAASTQRTFRLLLRWADRRFGCVLAEPYPPAGTDSLNQTWEDAQHSRTKPFEVGDPNPLIDTNLGRKSERPIHWLAFVRFLNVKRRGG